MSAYKPVAALVVAARLLGEPIPFGVEIARRFECPVCFAPAGFACNTETGDRMNCRGLRSISIEDMQMMKQARVKVKGYASQCNGVRDEIYQGAWSIPRRTETWPPGELRQTLAKLTPDQLKVLDELTKP